MVADQEGETAEERFSKAAECFGVFRIQAEAVVVNWKLTEVQETMLPVLGAACRELLSERTARKVFLDFSIVDEMSTAAIGTLVRFKKTAVHLAKEVHLIAGPKLQAQLRAAYVDRILGIHESIYAFLFLEIQFVERRQVRESDRCGWLEEVLAMVHESRVSPGPLDRAFSSVHPFSRKSVTSGLCERIPLSHT